MTLGRPADDYSINLYTLSADLVRKVPKSAIALVVPQQRLQTLQVAGKELAHVGRGGGRVQFDAPLLAATLVLDRQHQQQGLRDAEQGRQQRPRQHAPPTDGSRCGQGLGSGEHGSVLGRGAQIRYAVSRMAGQHGV